MCEGLSVLHLNVTDGGGGAARAAYRLHRGLLNTGVRSRMLVNYKGGDDDTVTKRRFRFLDYVRTRLHPYADKVVLRRYPRRTSTAWSTNLIPRRTAECANRIAPDIVNLHWIGDGFVSNAELVRFDAPLVWTLHDMWPFTGGCHYDEDCGRYLERCGHCPQLQSRGANDLSRWIWLQKQRALAVTPLVAVAPSRWLARCARDSALFRNARVEAIPYGLDLRQFRPRPNEEVRGFFDLPVDRKIILFSGSPLDQPSRKGSHFLPDALKRAAPHLGNSVLVSFGARQQDRSVAVPLPFREIGRIDDDETLAALYSAADLFVAPSVQDNLPNTVMESLACGTPVVAFDIGGMPDMIEHRENGYLAEPFQTDDLASGIAWALQDRERLLALSSRARQKAEREFAIELQARRYAELYTDILEAQT